MAFTDDDLKKLKEDLRFTGLDTSPFSAPTAILDLIGRLEAAERVCEVAEYFRSRFSGPEIQKVGADLVEWRRAAGK